MGFRKKSDITGYSRLLANERSFDGLFCDSLELEEKGTLFFNRSFPDDPVFNHVKVSTRLLTVESIELESFDRLFQLLRNATKDLSLSTASIFLEEFWPNAARFQRSAIDNGFRVHEQMKTLSKKLGQESRSERIGKGRIHVFETNDVESWNDIFMRSYLIPNSWGDELLRRERGFLKRNEGTTKLLAASERESEDASRAKGCLLLNENPKGIMGVYCVGTLPEARGRGIARSMLDHSEEIGKHRGCELMTLQTVVSDNVTPMYFKLGYELDFERNILQTS